MQTDPIDPAPPSAPSKGAKPRMSSLARASAIVGGLSMAICCFGALSGPIAVLLGMISLDRIRASNGTLRGRGVAWAGIVTGVMGVCLSLAFQWGVTGIQKSLSDQMDAAVRTTFAAVDDAGQGEALGKWLPLKGPTGAGEQIGSFARAAKERYGSFTDFSVTSELQKPDFMSGVHMIELAVDFEFADASPRGIIIAKLVPSSSQWMPVLLLDSIRIEDAERGALTLGGRPSAAPEPVPAGSQPGGAS
ncbi:MAG: DUF4190 domain-containing protein [bacterium]|jgi:hypothetical protein